MNVIEIIKDAFEYPSKNLKIFAIYVVLTVLAGAFSIGGAFGNLLGLVHAESSLWGGMALILSMLIGWIMSGYLISIIKSGINHDSEVPEFEWWENFNTGFNNFIVSIVYFIIPAFIVFIAGSITNVYGNIIIVAQNIITQVMNVVLGYSTTIATDALAQPIANLMTSLAITSIVAAIVFIIFAFLKTIAEARLANTGSLTEALNVFESAKDIGRIGVGKVIILLILIGIIVCLIQMILSVIFSFVPILAILSIIITPYLTFFTYRAVGLLYSDIA